MKKLILKEGVEDFTEGRLSEREDYETESDTKLIEALAKRGYSLDPDTAYKGWLAISMDWDASWLMWQGDSDEMIAEYLKFFTVVEE
jgi:hypothetical protein